MERLRNLILGTILGTLAFPADTIAAKYAVGLCGPKIPKAQVEVVTLRHEEEQLLAQIVKEAGYELVRRDDHYGLQVMDPDTRAKRLAKAGCHGAVVVIHGYTTVNEQPRLLYNPWLKRYQTSGGGARNLFDFSVYVLRRVKETPGDRSLATTVPAEAASDLVSIREAATQGDADAQMALGVLYYQGLEGLEKDYSEAVRWFRKAAEQEHTAAQGMMGVAHLYGMGVVQDYQEAVLWFGKAAERADPTAQFALGLAYVEGKGVPQDFVLAHKWLNLATAGGHAESREVLKRLAEQMTSEQVAEAQRLAREWEPQNQN